MGYNSMVKRIPTRVKIGAFLYKVIANKASLDTAGADFVILTKKEARAGLSIQMEGLSDHHQQIIYLDPSMAPDALCTVFLHEILHTVCAQSTREIMPIMDEERVVSAIAPLLLQVLRDNPNVLAFLLNPRSADASS